MSGFEGFKRENEMLIEKIEDALGMTFLLFFITVSESFS